jgi:K+-transporting ATPase KdpF subunit
VTPVEAAAAVLTILVSIYLLVALLRPERL